MILIINIMAGQRSSNVLRRQQVAQKCPSHQEWHAFRSGYLPQRRVFRPGVRIFPAQTRVGNGLTVSERLTATIFCVPSRRKLSAIIPAIAESHCGFADKYPHKLLTGDGALLAVTVAEIHHQMFR